MSAELNLRVAALMGWEQVENRYTWRSDLTGELMITGIAQDHPACNFYPAGNEGSIGLVLDRIVTLGWGVTTYTGPYPDRDGPVGWCSIMRDHDGQSLVNALVNVLADTRPLAICEAFIRAMEMWG